MCCGCPRPEAWQRQCWNWRAANFGTHAPRVLPGGKALLFQAIRTPPSQDNSSVDVVSIADRHRKTLVRGVGSARYVLSGHLVYTNKSTMFAVPFDLERLETRGTAVAVLDDVAYDAVASEAQFDVSQRGTLVYRRRSGGASSSATVQWLDPTGKQVPLLAKPGAYVGTPRVSPDGKRIAIAIKDGANQDIWVYEPQRDAMTRLTFGGQFLRIRCGAATDGTLSSVRLAAAFSGVALTVPASRRCSCRARASSFPLH